MYVDVRELAPRGAVSRGWDSWARLGLGQGLPYIGGQRADPAQARAPGVVHPWVTRIVLVCNEIKTKSVRPTERRSEGRTHAHGGYGCTWLAVLSHAGTLGACDETLLQLRRRTPRPVKLPSSE